MRLTPPTECLIVFGRYTHRKHLNYYLFICEPPLICRTIDWTKESLLLLRTRSTFIKSVVVSGHGVRCRVIDHGVKIDVQYCWDILLSQQMLAAIKHIAWLTIFAGQRTVESGVQHFQLLQRKGVNFIYPEL